jgi:hypothetical protein
MAGREVCQALAIGEIDWFIFTEYFLSVHDAPQEYAKVYFLCKLCKRGKREYDL